MTDERICPICKKPVASKEGVYRVCETDYHRECYEKRTAGRDRDDRD